MNVNESFAGWLLEQMERKGLSQADLSRLSGVSRQTIKNYLTQNRLTPDKASLRAFAHTFNMPAEQVFREAGLLPPVDSPVKEETPAPPRKPRPAGSKV